VTPNIDEVAVQVEGTAPGGTELAEAPLEAGAASPRTRVPSVPSPRAHIRKPSRPWPGVNVRELWRYRELFFFLVWRDIKVRYAQTVLGAGWAILQPVLNMVVFTLIFGSFAKVPSEGVPYPVFSLTALVPWTYFSTALNLSGQSLVGNPNLITKVYFPRLVIPFSPVLAGLVDFCIAFVILLAMMGFYHRVPVPLALGVVPLLVLVTVMTAAGVGSWLAALNIRYRDIKHVSPFLVQAWMYLSPVVYPMSSVPARYRPIYALNPMSGVIEGFRSVLLQSRPIDWGMQAISIGAALVLFVTGLLYFRHTEKVFADVA